MLFSNFLLNVAIIGVFTEVTVFVMLVLFIFKRVDLLSLNSDEDFKEESKVIQQDLLGGFLMNMLKVVIPLVGGGAGVGALLLNFLGM